MAEVTVQSLLKRANMFLEDKEFAKADEYAERVLDMNPELAEAYLIKLCCDFKVSSCAALGNLKVNFTENNNYKKIIRFGGIDLKKELKNYAAKAEENKKLADDTKKVEHEKELAEVKRLEDLRKKYAVASKMIAAGEDHIVGLKTDGTVVAFGNNNHGQCNVKDWRDLAGIAAGKYHTVGVKKDGTAVAVGNNEDYQCQVSHWRDIIAVSAGEDYTIGLKSDGTVTYAGYTCWDKYSVKNWRDIVAIAAGDRYAVGLKKDGTVVVAESSGFYQRNVSDWKLFDSVDTIAQEREIKTAELKRIEEEKRKAAEEERKRIEEEKRQADENRINGLLQKRCALQTELANLKGLFTGKRKKEIGERLACIEKKLKKLNYKENGTSNDSSSARGKINENDF